MAYLSSSMPSELVKSTRRFCSLSAFTNSIAYLLSATTSKKKFLVCEQVESEETQKYFSFVFCFSFFCSEVLNKCVFWQFISGLARLHIQTFWKKSREPNEAWWDVVYKIELFIIIHHIYLMRVLIHNNM